jgi:hypothetical protein
VLYGRVLMLLDLFDGEAEDVAGGAEHVEDWVLDAKVPV